MIRFAIALALVAAVTYGQVTLSQTVDSATITNNNSIACLTNTVPAFHTQNGFFRSYNLSAAGITTPIDILNVNFGVEAALAGPAGAGLQPLQIRLYTDPTPTTTGTGLTLLHTEFLQIADTSVTGSYIVSQPMTSVVTVMPTDTVVVELFAPDGTVAQNLFFPGSNGNGQTAPCYLEAPGCGLTPPTDIAGPPINQQSMHLILDLVFIPSGGSLVYPGTNEDLLLQSSINLAPLTSGIGNDVKTVTFGDGVSMLFSSPGGTFSGGELAIVAEVFVTGAPPSPAFPGINISLTGGILIVGGASTPFGPILLPSSGFAMDLAVPPGLAGTSVLFQALIPTPVAANFIFASSEGHEFLVM